MQSYYTNLVEVNDRYDRPHDASEGERHGTTGYDSESVDEDMREDDARDANQQVQIAEAHADNEGEQDDEDSDGDQAMSESYSMDNDSADGDEDDDDDDAEEDDDVDDDDDEYDADNGTTFSFPFTSMLHAPISSESKFRTQVMLIPQRPDVILDETHHWQNILSVIQGIMKEAMCISMST